MLRQQKAVALVLSLAYSVIAAAGHGLHALAPCGDSACQQATVACDCGCHAEAPQSDASGGGPAFDAAAGDCHNPHTCAICTVIAKVKVGHDSPQTASLAHHLVVAPVAVVPLTVVGDQLLTNGPRGPPAENA